VGTRTEIGRSAAIRSGRWSRITERGSRIGLAAMVWCYRVFGHTLCLPLVHGIVLYFFLTDRAGRRASRDYLERVHARPEGAAALARRPGLVASFLHYRAFALAILDRIRIWLGREGELRYQVEGREALYERVVARRGALVLGAHLGSFDALRAMATRDRVRVNVLMFTRNAERINGIFRSLSPDVDVRVIRADPGSVASVLEIRSCIERGEIVAILADRSPAGRARAAEGRGRSCSAEFLGEAAEFPAAPFLLASALGCSVFLMVALRTGPRAYRVVTELLADRVERGPRRRDAHVQELVDAYASRLEHYCLEAPLQWFNFYDFWAPGAGRGE